jgi:hypothetical protein
MAVYGLSGDGKVPFTGYTNTLGTADATTGVTSGYVQFNGIGQQDDKIAKAMRHGSSGRVLRALWYALSGAAAGGAASVTKKRVTATQGGNLDGLIPIETQTILSRNTTAADLTAIKALMDRVVYPSSYPADLSGNGGGGKGSY